MIQYDIKKNKCIFRVTKLHTDRRMPTGAPEQEQGQWRSVDLCVLNTCTCARLLLGQRCGKRSGKEESMHPLQVSESRGFIIENRKFPFLPFFRLFLSPSLETRFYSVAQATLELMPILPQLPEITGMRLCLTCFSFKMQIKGNHSISKS